DRGHAGNHLWHAYGHEKRVRPGISLIVDVGAADVGIDEGAREKKGGEKEENLQCVFHLRSLRIQSPHARPKRVVRMETTSAAAMVSANAAVVLSRALN